MSTETSPPPTPSETYEASCHCGYIKFSVTLSPPLPETKPLQCDCSACRRFGYLLVYMVRDDVAWHGDSWARLSRYQFNTKQKDQLFCGRCGASLGIDFRESQAPRPSMFGISVRTFNGIDLDTLEFRPLKGSKLVAPGEDLSGIWYEQEVMDKEVEEKEKEEKEKKEREKEEKEKEKEEKEEGGEEEEERKLKEEDDEKELAAAAQTA